MLTLSLDPGLRDSGVALLEADRLVACALIQACQKYAEPVSWTHLAERIVEWAESRGQIDAWAYEMPQVYTRSPGDPNDLLQLVGVLGAVAARLSARFISPYRPRQWKGQVPKDIHHPRMLRALLTPEKKIIDEVLSGIAQGLRHNVLDAVALGLYHVKRIARSGKKI